MTLDTLAIHDSLHRPDTLSLFGFLMTIDTLTIIGFLASFDSLFQHGFLWFNDTISFITPLIRSEHMVFHLFALAHSSHVGFPFHL
jgi:hypothetical protein